MRFYPPYCTSEDSVRYLTYHYPNRKTIPAKEYLSHSKIYYNKFTDQLSSKCCWNAAKMSQNSPLVANIKENNRMSATQGKILLKYPQHLLFVEAAN